MTEQKLETHIGDDTPVVDWIDWDIEQPPKAGMYLTSWTDGSVETYPMDEDEIKNENSAPESCGQWVLAWAYLPKAFNE